MTAAFDAQLVAAARTPCYLLELTTLHRCANTYASNDAPSTCEAPDLGDGARCYYSRATCQDPANFRPESFTLRWTSNDVPLPVEIAEEYPAVRHGVESVSPVAQSIDLAKSSTSPAHLTVKLKSPGGHSDAGPFDLDKSVRNTGRAGSTLRRWLAQWPNFGRMILTQKLGFIAEGFAVEDWATRFSGTLSRVEISTKDEWTFTAESFLSRAKKELPRRYSTTIQLAATVEPGDTTWSVTDASEIQAGDVLLITGVTAEDEIVTVDSVDTGADEIDVTRAVNGTKAGYALAGSHLTSVLDYKGARPVAIVQDLLARVGITEIDTDSFDLADQWIGPVGLTRRIPDSQSRRTTSTSSLVNGDDPVECMKLVTEVLELFQCALRENLDGTIGIAMNRPLASDEDPEVITDERILSNSSHGTSGEPQRLTHVAIVWDKESDSDYTVTAAVNGETFVDSYYGSEPEDRREKKIESAWLRPGSSTAWGSAVRWSHCFAHPPRGLEWNGSLRDEGMQVGTIIETDTSEVQDAHGANLAKRMMVISRRPSEDMKQIAFSAQATGFDATTASGERWGSIAPDATPVYGSASAEEKARYIFLGDADNLVGSAEPGYVLS